MIPWSSRALWSCGVVSAVAASDAARVAGVATGVRVSGAAPPIVNGMTR